MTQGPAHTSSYLQEIVPCDVSLQLAPLPPHSFAALWSGLYRVRVRVRVRVRARAKCKVNLSFQLWKKANNELSGAQREENLTLVHLQIFLEPQAFSSLYKTALKAEQRHCPGLMNRLAKSQNCVVKIP